MTKISFIGCWALSWAARLVLAGIFIYAGLLKMDSPLEFADSIAAYRILPASMIDLLALGLPPFEFACGLLVLLGFHRRAGLLGMVGMLGVFMGAAVTALLWKLPIDCGCFGANSWFASSLWAALIRDGVLLLLAMLLYRKSLLQKAGNQAFPASGSPECP